MFRNRLPLISLVAICLFIAGCVSIESSPVSGNKRAYGYSWDQELKIGRDADKEIIAQYGLYDDQKLND